MIDHRDTNVVRIPIDQIIVMNPRERGKVWSRVQRAMTTSLGRHGTDVLTERDRANAPSTAAEAAYG